MFEYEKLQSPLNRSLHTPIEKLAVFWAECVPEDYCDIASHCHTDEARTYLLEVIEAQRQAAKLLNRLTALRGDLEGLADSHQVVIDNSGRPRIDCAGSVRSLSDVMFDYIDEEQQEVRARFGM